MEGKNYGCGWVSDLTGFRSENHRAIIFSLEEFVREVSESQRRAWWSMLPALAKEFAETVEQAPSARSFNAILEYELPYEGGRRPDVVVLENGVVAVLEFKDKSRVHPEDVDQVAAYARDLRGYHALCHDAVVEPVLVPTRWSGRRHHRDGVHICEPSGLDTLLIEFSTIRPDANLWDPLQWLEAEYAPLPSLVEAARRILDSKPLPTNERALSAGLPEVHRFLLALAQRAAQARTRELVLLTGVPGSGKTLAGIQFAYSSELDRLAVRRPGFKWGSPAVFLSGNGPLVEVLQHALGSTVFVRPMKKFIDYFGYKRPTHPAPHVIVFDEAQRAFDAPKMNKSHKRSDLSSEPRAILEIAERTPEWCVVLALVGEGQEIHEGEEAGLRLWADAIEATESPGDWTIHGPASVEAAFRGSRARIASEPRLNLSATLRSHLAADIHEWVRLFLEEGAPALPKLRPLADQMRGNQFVLYWTRDLERAKSYARNRYLGEQTKRYGLLASNMAKNMLDHGVDVSFPARRSLKGGPWFNSPPGDPLSCCALERVASEFECQGLELDLPIVCWGDDLLWNGTRLIPRARASRGSLIQDPGRLRINAYRVLMTRGRDGLCVFIPPTPSREMEDIARYADAAGVVELSEDLT